MADRNSLEEFAHGNGYGFTFFGEDIKAIIFGEAHGYSRNVKKQLELIARTKPEFILHELMRNYCLDFGVKVLQENPEYKKSSKAQKFLLKAVGEEGHHYFGAHKEFLAWLKKFGMQSRLNAFEVGYFSLDFIDGVSLSTLLLHQPPNGLKALVGCDFSFAEIRQYEQENHIHHSDGIGSINCPPEHDYMREMRFAKVIYDYAQKTEKPLIVVVGEYHIRANSAIHDVLRKNNIGYACIEQNLKFK